MPIPRQKEVYDGSGSLQYYGDKSVVWNNSEIIDFLDPKKIDSFKFKQQILGQAAKGGTNNEIMIPLKYLSKFWRIHKIFLINSKIK